MHTMKEWFLSHRRSLPWRDEPTPYRVWVSEVMLQQTQAAVVVPYFLRWMTLFPTIEMLADASIDEVIKAWEGLGYYARARNLHEGARSIVKDYGGKIPSDPNHLAQIKGIGPYTVGAICSFAFKQKRAAVDGNVLRVISRLDGIGESIDLPKTRQKITERVEELLPACEPWLAMEGLIELGATVCKKEPLCHNCPLTGECLAFRHQKTDQLPVRGPRAQTVRIQRYVAVVTHGNKILVQRREKGSVMADLYEFPFIEKKEEAQKGFEQLLDLELNYRSTLAKQHHTYTKYRVELFPLLFWSRGEDHRFVDRQNLDTLPFSSGHRRILNELLKG